MRPEITAFRELDALVRSLTDQLAGFRRRAMAAESRTRDLEQALDELRESVAQARASATAANEARMRAEEAAREANAKERAAHALLARAEANASGSMAAIPLEGSGDDTVGEVFPTPSGTVNTPLTTVLTHEVVQENEVLRARLGEARERTVQLTERVRFLRQQMTTGGER